MGFRMFVIGGVGFILLYALISWFISGRISLQWKRDKRFVQLWAAAVI